MTKCDAGTAGYDGWFGLYCDRPMGHAGLHCEGGIEWREVATSHTSSGKPIGETHECGRENDLHTAPHTKKAKSR